MLECACQFLETHPLAVPVPRVAILHAEMNTLLARYRIVVASQKTGDGDFRAGAAERRQFLEVLLQKMRDINAIARAMDPVEFAGVSDLFRMPRSQAVEAILANALAFARHAQTMEDAFLERGLPAGFIGEIEASIQSAREAVSPKNLGLMARMAATVELQASLTRVLAIRRELDAILTPLLRADPKAFAAWKSAQHVARPTRRKRETTTEKDATPAAAEMRSCRLAPRPDFAALSDESTKEMEGSCAEQRLQAGSDSGG